VRVGPVRRSRRLDPSAQEYVAVANDVPEVLVDDTATIEQPQQEEVVENNRLLQFSRSRDELYEYQQKEEVALINETWFKDHDTSLAPNNTQVQFNDDNMEDIRYIGGLKDQIDPKMVELEPLIEQMKKTYPFRFDIGSTLQVLLHNCNTYQFLGEIYSLEEKLECLLDDEWRALHSQAFSGVLDEIKIKVALRLEDNTSTNETLTIINNSTIERVVVNHVEQHLGLLADEEEKVVINNNSKQDGIRDWLGAGLLLMAVTSSWDSSDTIEALTIAVCIYITATVIPKMVSSTSTLLGRTAWGMSRVLYYSIYTIITLLCKLVSSMSTLVVYTGREVVSSISSFVTEGINHVKWQRILADEEVEPREVEGNNNSKQEGILHWLGTGLLVMMTTRNWEPTTTVQVLTVAACIYITMSLLCKMLSSISSLVVDVGQLIRQALQHLTSSAHLIGCIRRAISTYDAMIDICDWLGLESVADTLFSLKSWVVRQLNRVEGAGLDLLEWATSRDVANTAQRMIDWVSRKIHVRAVKFDAHEMVHLVQFKPDVSWSIDTMANWNYFHRHYIYLFVKGWCKEMQQGLLHPDLCEILVDMEKYYDTDAIPNFLGQYQSKCNEEIKEARRDHSTKLSRVLLELVATLNGAAVEDDNINFGRVVDDDIEEVKDTQDDKAPCTPQEAKKEEKQLNRTLNLEEYRTICCVDEMKVQEVVEEEAVQPPVEVTSSSNNDDEMDMLVAAEETDDVQPPLQEFTSTNNTNVGMNDESAVEEDDVLPPDQADNIESDAPKKKKFIIQYSEELGTYYALLADEANPNQVWLIHYDAHGVFPFFVSPLPKGVQPAVFVAAQGRHDTDEWDECADIPEEYEAESDDDTDKDREKKIIKRRLYARAKKSRINDLADNLALSIIHRYKLKKLPTTELEWLYLLCYSRHWKSRDGPTAAYLAAFRDACVAWEDEMYEKEMA